MLAEGTSMGVAGFLASAFGNWERKRKLRRRFMDLSDGEVARKKTSNVGVLHMTVASSKQCR